MKELNEKLKCTLILRKELITGEISFTHKFENDLKTVSFVIKTDKKVYEIGDQQELNMKDLVEEDKKDDDSKDDYEDEHDEQ